MPHTLRPLSLGQLLDETFYIYRHHWLLFICISAAPNTLVLLIQLLAEQSNVNARADNAVAGMAVLAIGIASWFAGSIATAAATFAVSDIYLDIPTSFAACYARVWGKAARVAGATLLVSLIVGLGFLLLVAPGIYWAGLYGVAIPAVVLENITASESLKRSSNLTRGSVGRVIIVYFLTSIFGVAMAMAIGAGVSALGPAVFHQTGILTKEVVEQILTALAQILFGPVTAIGLTLVYYDQRVRKEAFDIEHMMRMMATPETLRASSGSSAS